MSTSPSKFCEQCGTQLAADVAFCTSCGQPVDGDGEPGVARPGSESPARVDPAAPAPVAARQGRPSPSPRAPIDRRKTLKVLGVVSGVMLLIAAGAGAYLKLTDPEADAVSDATASAARTVISRDTADRYVVASFRNRPFGDLQNQGAGPTLRATGSPDVHVDVKAVRGHSAAAVVTAKYTATIRDGAHRKSRSLGATSVAITERWRVAMRKSADKWRIAWIMPTKPAAIAFRRPIQASAADVTQAKALAEKAISAFASHTSAESDKAWMQRQQPYYADTLNGDDVGPFLDTSYGDALGPLPDVLRVSFLAGNGDYSTASVNLTSVRPSDVQTLSERSVSALRGDALYQHAEIEGELTISGGKLDACPLDTYLGGFSNAVTSSAGTFRAELIRSRLSATSLWYVRQLSMSLHDKEVTVAEQSPGRSDRPRPATEEEMRSYSNQEVAVLDCTAEGY